MKDSEIWLILYQGILGSGRVNSVIMDALKADKALIEYKKRVYPEESEGGE
jgi:hypothetical protein